MAVSLYLYSVNKKIRSTKQMPFSGEAIQCLLKSDSSIITPTFRIQCGVNGAPAVSAISVINYCYCLEFERYYFIRDIIYETATIVAITCDVDVLGTYRDEILDTDAFIEYSESAYNGMIPDTRLQLTDRFVDTQKAIYNFLPNSWYTDEGSYILTVASNGGNGNTGVCASYVLTASQLQAVADKLYSEDFLTQLRNELSQPLNSIIKCIWIPYDSISMGNGFSEVKLGTQGTGITGGLAKEYIEEEISIEPFVPYMSRWYDTATESWIENYSDFRNLSPYTKYFITLPGAGLVELPMENNLGKGEEVEIKFTGYFCLSPITGDLTWIISKKGNTGTENKYGDVLTIVSGKVGTELPVSAMQTNVLGEIKSAISTVASGAMAFVGGMTANPFLVASGAGGVVSNLATMHERAFQSTTGYSGNLGGFSNRGLNEKPMLYTRQYSISDAPSNISNTIGRPLFAKRKLSTLSGVVICSGARVSITGCSATESEMINTMLNSREGVIIE